ncbi:hypothetical protein H4R35_003584 [Dimargaris xerosporica]|nr:hypothetical protein H4R35_003584 [Dimargaris xerosporica]
MTSSRRRAAGLVQRCPLIPASLGLIPRTTRLPCFRPTLAPRRAGTSSIAWRLLHTGATCHQSPRLDPAHSVQLRWPASCSSYDGNYRLLVSDEGPSPLRNLDRALAEHNYAQLHKAYIALRAQPDHLPLEHRGFYLVIRLALTAFLHLESGAATSSPVLPSAPHLIPLLPAVAAFIRIVAEDWLSALRSAHDSLLNPAHSNCDPALIHTTYHYVLYALRRSHQRAFALEALRQIQIQGVPTVHLLAASILQDYCDQNDCSGARQTYQQLEQWGFSAHPRLLAPLLRLFSQAGLTDQVVWVLDLYNMVQSNPAPGLLTKAAVTLMTNSAHHARVIQLYEQVRPHLALLKGNDLCSWMHTLVHLQRSELIKEVYAAYRPISSLKSHDIYHRLVPFAAQHDPAWIPHLHQDITKTQWKLVPTVTAYLIYGYARLDRVDGVLELLPWAPITLQPPLTLLELCACLENLLRMGLSVLALALLNAADRGGQPAISSTYTRLLAAAVHHDQPAVCLALYHQWRSSSCVVNPLVALEMASALHATGHGALAKRLYRRTTARLAASDSTIASVRIRIGLQLGLYDEMGAIYQQLSSAGVTNQLRWADTRALVLAATEHFDTRLFTTLFQDMLARRSTFTTDMCVVLGNGCLALRCVTSLDTLVDQLVTIHPRLAPSVTVEWVGQAFAQQQPLQADMLATVFIQHVAGATIDQCHALLATFLSHRGNVATMQQLVTSMEAPNSGAPVPTATTWALLLRTLHQARADATVVQVFRWCFPRHCVTDTQALAAAMCSLVCMGHPTEARYVWEWAERHHYQWHPRALTKLLEVFAPTTYRAFTRTLYRQGLALLTTADIAASDHTQLATSLSQAALSMQTRADFLMLWSAITQCPSLRPDTPLLTALLEACWELNVQQSHKILEWARCHQIPLDGTAHRILVQLYCQRGQFMEAMGVVDTLMPTAGLQPDQSIVQSLAAQLAPLPPTDFSKRRLKTYAQVCGAPVTDWVAEILK